MTPMTPSSLAERITRSLAYMLRHRPDEFDLELDRYGYAELDEVVRALNERLDEPIDEDDLLEAIEGGDRQRYEIQNGRIRALYGHSIDVDPGKPTRPPEFLYLGVGSRDAQRARRHGLRGGRRRFLHLAKTRDDAIETGRRIAREYAVIRVRALEAWEEGVNFYDRGALFLADSIPTEFLEVGEVRDDGVPNVSRRDERDDGRRGPRSRTGEQRAAIGGRRSRSSERARSDAAPRRGDLEDTEAEFEVEARRSTPERFDRSDPDRTPRQSRASVSDSREPGTSRGGDDDSVGSKAHEENGGGRRRRRRPRRRGRESEERDRAAEEQGGRREPRRREPTGTASRVEERERLSSPRRERESRREDEGARPRARAREDVSSLPGRDAGSPERERIEEPRAARPAAERARPRAREEEPRATVPSRAEEERGAADTFGMGVFDADTNDLPESRIRASAAPADHGETAFAAADREDREPSPQSRDRGGFGAPVRPADSDEARAASEPAPAKEEEGPTEEGPAFGAGVL